MSERALNKRLYMRFVLLLAIAAILFTAIWSVSYYFLPEGLLRSQRGLSNLVRENAPSLTLEWLRISGVNLIPMILILLFNRLMRINQIPLGYLVPFVNLVLYGVFLGTNSFALQMAEPMPPSFQVLTRSGPYEMMAFLLMAVSTHSISRYEIKRLFVTNPEKVTPANLVLSREQWVGVLISLVLLFGAALREAYMVVSV